MMTPPPRPYTPGDLLNEGHNNARAFLQGIKDAKAAKNKALLENAALVIGTVAYMRYRNAKKAGRK